MAMSATSSQDGTRAKHPIVKPKEEWELALEAKIQQLQARAQELRKAEINRLTRDYLHNELHGKPRKCDLAYVLKALLGIYGSVNILL